MIYSFNCECGSTRDLEQSIHAAIEEPMCTDCHQMMSRSWSSPAITFKGPGFTVTVGKRSSPTRRVLRMRLLRCG